MKDWRVWLEGCCRYLMRGNDADIYARRVIFVYVCLTNFSSSSSF